MKRPTTKEIIVEIAKRMDLDPKYVFNVIEEDCYKNEPDEKYDDHNTQLQTLSGGVNKKKKMHKRVEPGDNPMTVADEEAKKESKKIKTKDIVLELAKRTNTDPRKIVKAIKESPENHDAHVQTGWDEVGKFYNDLPNTKPSYKIVRVSDRTFNVVFKDEDVSELIGTIIKRDIKRVGGSVTKWAYIAKPKYGNNSEMKFDRQREAFNYVIHCYEDEVDV